MDLLVSDQIIEIFLGFIKQEDQLISSLKINEFKLSKHHWHFTLPNLFKFLIVTNSDFKRLAYQDFRNILFNSPINQTLAEKDAEIMIIDNHNNVDRSIYALVVNPKINHKKSQLVPQLAFH